MSLTIIVVAVRGALLAEEAGELFAEGGVVLA
jgi:hypothetical protein